MLSAGRRWCQVGGRHDTQHTRNWDSQNKTLGPINKINKAPSGPVHHKAEYMAIVAVCRVNHGKVKLDALLSEGHTRACQCKDVPLICQRLQVNLLDTGYPVG